MRLTIAQEKAMVRRMRAMVRFHHKDKQWKEELPVTGLSYVLERTCSLCIRFIWMIAILGCFILCMYQCYDRIAYFVDEPVAVNIAFRDVDSVPTTTLCVHETKEQWELKQECMKYHSAMQSADINPMFDFLACVPHVGMKLEKLWRLLNTTELISFVGTVDDKGTEIPIKFTRKEEMLGSGICNHIQIDTFSKKELERIQLRGLFFKIECPLETCTTALMGTVQKGDNPIDARRSWGVTMLSYVSGGISTTEFNFINRRKDHCVDNEAHFSCYKKCFLEEHEKNFDCRFPHFPQEMRVPECKENLTELYQKSLSLRFQTDPITSCNCTRRCKTENIQGMLTYEGLADNGTIIAIQIYDRSITVYDEIIAYDFTDLLCEIGGNLGLNLGLSILSAVQLCYLLLLKNFKKQEFRPADPLFRKIVNEYIKMEKLGNQGGLQFCSSVTAVLKTVIITGLTVASLWFVYVRMQYFNSYPTRMLVKAVENKTVLYPQIIICSDSKKVGAHKMRVARKRNPDDCPSLNLNLLDTMEKFKNDVNKMWAESSNEKNFVHPDAVEKMFASANLGIKNVTVTYPLLPEGNCTKLDIGSRIHLGTTYTYLLFSPIIRSSLGCMKDHSIVYFYPNEEPLDLNTYFYTPVSTAMMVMFSYKKVELLNTPTKRCISSAEYYSCVTQCQWRRLFNLINCSLPYMPPNPFPLCKNMSSAKAASQAYQTAFMSVDPLTDCSCISRCDWTIYTMTTYFEDISNKPISILAFMFYSNMMLTYQEELAYSFTAFVCDVGGNLGITLGFSVLSVFEITQSIVKRITSLRSVVIKSNHQKS